MSDVGNINTKKPEGNPGILRLQAVPMDRHTAGQLSGMAGFEQVSLC